MSVIEDIVGRVVDEKYLVDSMLGRGGMGAVYRATHLGTDRPVALKIIAPELMQNQDSVERFRREAKAMGRLYHPNIVNVTDFGVWSGDLGPIAYLVMEYLEGLSLKQLLEREGALPLRASIEILEQVCVGMERAHRQGILHRDLKPDNIWLEPNDLGGHTVKVLDFGLARITAADAEVSNSDNNVPSSEVRSPPVPDASTAADEVTDNEATAVRSGTDDVGYEDSTVIRATNRQDEDTETVIRDSTPANTEPYDADSSATAFSDRPSTGQPASRAGSQESDGLVTRVGSLLGTPIYMSPEQCRGESIDARSDIYSLGIIAHEMLSGSRPFTGSTQDLIWKHNHEAPPRLTNYGIPRGVSDLVSESLAKDARERPASPAKFAAMLKARAESFGRTLHRALLLYTEHLRPVFLISLAGFVPLIIVTLVGLFIPDDNPILALVYLAFTLIAVAVALAIIVGLISPVVAQVLLRPFGTIRLDIAVQRLKNNYAPYTLASLRFVTRAVVTLFPLVALFLFLVQGNGLQNVPSAGGAETTVSTAPPAVAEPADQPVESTPPGEKVAHDEEAYGLGYRLGRAARKKPLLLGLLLAIPLALLIALGYFIGTSPRRLASSLLYGPALMMESLSARDAIARSRELYPSVRLACWALITLVAVLYTMSITTGSVIYLLVKPVAGAAVYFLIRAADEILSLLALISVMPLIVIALTLLYFRARQSRGDTIPEILSQYIADASPDESSRLTLDTHRFSSSTSRS